LATRGYAMPDRPQLHKGAGWVWCPGKGASLPAHRAQDGGGLSPPKLLPHVRNQEPALKME